MYYLQIMTNKYFIDREAKRARLMFVAGVGVVVVASLGISPTAFARETTRWGPIGVISHTAFEGIHDDNVYLSRSLTKGSGIGRVSHETAFELEGKRSRVTIGYGATVMRYAESYWINNVFHQKGQFAAGYEFGKGKRIRLTDQFIATTDPASSELVARARRNQNDAEFALELPLGRRLFLGADVHHELHYYIPDSLADLLNRKELTVSPRIGFRVGSRTRVYGRYSHRSIAYDFSRSEKDSVTSSIRAGVEGKLASRTSGRIEAGVFMRDYDRTSSTLMTDSVTSPSIEVAVDWEGRRNLNVSVKVARAPREAIFNRFYTGTSVGVVIGKRFQKRWRVGVVVGYERAEYPDAVSFAGASKERKDTVIQAGIDIEYQTPKFVSVKVGYLHRSRASNLDRFNYGNRIISAGIHFDY